MQTETSLSSKPRSEIIGTDIIRFTRLTVWRRLIRRAILGLCRFLVFVLTRPIVTGLENLPKKGPALIVSNHLGDADLIIGFAYCPVETDPVAKIELHRIPLLGFLLKAYGVIWVRRGQPDRQAMRIIFEALKEGRFVAIAPEGRESLTGALEEGTGGAAYIALKADVPVIPVTFTGTENNVVYQNLKRLRRSLVTVTIGQPFRLENMGDRRKSVKVGTKKVMKTLAAQLPPERRGVYAP